MRQPRLRGSGTAIERRGRKHTYSILQSPLPAFGYAMRLRMSESADGHSCIVKWSSEFQPLGTQESAVVEVIRGVCEAGFKNLRRLFGR